MIGRNFARNPNLWSKIKLPCQKILSACFTSYLLRKFWIFDHQLFSVLLRNFIFLTKIPVLVRKFTATSDLF